MAGSKRAVLITGPTASGKSALAIKLARRHSALVVNCDSMQVYDVLSVLTARPQPADLMEAEHRLYGFVSPATRFSVAAWLTAVKSLLAEAGDRPLIFVGGSGLYFEALENGIAQLPPVPDQITEQIATEIKGLDGAGRAALLVRRDPTMAARLKVADPQRTVRALAVLAATGRSLAAWTDEGQGGVLGGHDIERIGLDPGREVVRARIASRFGAIMEGEGAEEVATLLALKLDPGLPAMKAIGVREIADWQAGTISRATAMERAITATRQYAKRQRTWFRARMSHWDWRS
ncbi:MAG: tRNA (adenosine(37)-N6)-dimethylallyltransferase MiaA [Alphaproteobacteria bacterium]|nr:tRNA (adenosine(37)-N6)-dimethylallyltransferase MiaA [Alphaproteobacteria bacterium]